MLADIPVKHLTDEAPLYERPMREPQTGAAPTDDTVRDEAKQVITEPAGTSGGAVPVNVSVVNADELQEILEAPSAVISSAEADHDDALRRLLASPNLASKEWVYRQYDHMVRTNTAVLPGADAAVVRIKETRRALAMCLDGNGRYSAADPREGARQIVAEAARNVVCVGAPPPSRTFTSPRPSAPSDVGVLAVIAEMAEACTAINAVISATFILQPRRGARHPPDAVSLVGLTRTCGASSSGLQGEGN